MKNISFKSTKEFFDYIKIKKCIAFGAGRKLDEICRDIPELGASISYIIDNNRSLHGKIKKVGTHDINIYSLEKLEKENHSDLIVVITSSYKEEIMKQLSENHFLYDIEICSFEDILDTVAWNAKGPERGYRKNNIPLIPKKIHYIWFSNNKIPDQLQKYIDGWKRLCPDYEFYCWNEKNYDISKNQYMYQAYKDKKWSFASDYARLDLVYCFGGIYLDTDVELIKRPDELLYNQAFIGFERLSSINSGSGFGAQKGFPLLKEMRDNYETIEFKNKENPNEMTLCPIYETGILQSHGLKLDGSFQIVDNMSVYPVMYFNAKSLYSNKLKITDETISIHHCSWTWAEKYCKIIGE